MRLAQAAGSPFVSRQAARALAAIPDAFGDSLSWCGLECRFDDDDRVDLMVCVERARARGLAAAMDRQPWLERWAWEAEWVRGWAARAAAGPPYVWFELDLAPGARAVPILLFVPFERELGRPPAANDVESVVAEAHLLSGTGLRAAAERALRRVLTAIPPAGWPLHIASLRQRGIDGCRLVVSVPAAAAADYAAAIGWPGSAVRLEALIGRVGRFGSHVNLSFDVTGAVGGRLGVDCFFPTRPALDPRWRPVLEILRQAGARPERLNAFQSWYGPVDTEAGAIFRNPFVKLIMDGDGPTIGKAYLAFHSWRENPGVSTSASRAGSPTPRP